MGLTHLILISILTPHHTPILPPFSSRPHLPVQAGFRSVSHIFDVERWARSINKEMVEWKDVKDLSGSAGRKAGDGSIQADGQDKLGCWSIWATSDLREQKPRDSHYFIDHLNLGALFAHLRHAEVVDSVHLLQTYHIHLFLIKLDSSKITRATPIRLSMPSLLSHMRLKKIAIHCLQITWPIPLRAPRLVIPSNPTRK